MPVHASQHRKATRTPSSRTSLSVPLLLLTLLLLVALIIVIREPQEIRKKAQEATPTPLLRCDVPCTYNSQCPSSLICFNSSCRNPQCTKSENCVCVVTPTPLAIVPTEVIIKTIATIPITNPTKAPVFMISSTNQPTSGITPTITSVLVPTFEVSQDNPPEDISLLRAIFSYISDLLCQLFKSC